MRSPLIVGDVVKVGNGPWMTVEYVWPLDRKKWNGEEKGISCVWFDIECHLQRANFIAACLTLKEE